MWLLFFGFVLCVEGAIFPDRSRHHGQCSIVGAESDDRFEDACQINGTLGKGPNQRFLLTFGETNCKITLKGCSPGVCYFAHDFTSRIPQDETPRPLPSSVFSSVAGAGVTWTKYGIEIVPTGRTVTITYSTVTCKEFYAYRGREWPQHCDEPFEGLSTLEAGLPFTCTAA